MDDQMDELKSINQQEDSTENAIKIDDVVK